MTTRENINENKNTIPFDGSVVDRLHSRGNLVSNRISSSNPDAIACNSHTHRYANDHSSSHTPPFPND